MKAALAVTAIARAGACADHRAQVRVTVVFRPVTLVDAVVEYPIGHDVGQPADHQLARAEYTPRAANGRMRRELGLPLIDQFQCDPRGGRGTVLPDVLRDLVEVALSVLCPAH